MNTLPSSSLYAVEPHSERLLRAVTSAWSTLGTFYWAVFRIWGFAILGGLALGLIAAAVQELRVASGHWYLGLPSLGLGLAFFVSGHVRRFAWALFGFGFFWWILVTLTLAAVMDLHTPVGSPVVSFALLALYFLPPLVATIASLYANRATR